MNTKAVITPINAGSARRSKKTNRAQLESIEEINRIHRSILPDQEIYPIGKSITDVFISSPSLVRLNNSTSAIAVGAHVTYGGREYFSWFYAFQVNEEAVKKLFYEKPSVFHLL